MKKQALLPLLLLSTASALPLAAQEAKTTHIELTPFASYNFEGKIDQSYYDGDFFDDDLAVDEGAGYGVILGFPVGRHFTVELSYSRQDTELFFDGGLFGDPEVVLPLDIEYLHLGGAINFGSGQVRPFVFGSAGVTRFSPGGDGYSDASRFSAALGGGAKIYFTDNIGLRLQGRLTSTLLDDGDESFCNHRDYCYYYDDDTYLYQAEVAAGIIFAF